MAIVTLRGIEPLPAKKEKETFNRHFNKLQKRLHRIEKENGLRGWIEDTVDLINTIENQKPMISPVTESPSRE